MPHAYPDLLRYARLVSKRPDEAEDILQSVLLAAVLHDRADLGDARNRRWLKGAIRKHALFVARSAARRRKRETLFVPTEHGRAEDSDFARLCASLPPALATTARLIGTGHSKREILWLLRIPIRRSGSGSWRSSAACAPPDCPPTISPAWPVPWLSA